MDFGKWKGRIIISEVEIALDRYSKEVPALFLDLRMNINKDW